MVVAVICGRDNIKAQMIFIPKNKTKHDGNYSLHHRLARYSCYSIAPIIPLSLCEERVELDSKEHIVGLLGNHEAFGRKEHEI